MLKEGLLNSKTPIKRKQLGTRAEVAKRMADPSKPTMIGLPGPKGGYIICPTAEQKESGVISCAEGTISMTSGGGSQTGHFYGNSVSFPEDAIVYSVQMNGVRTTSVSSIQLSNASSGNSINLNTYTWDKSGLVGLNMPASATWTAVFGYNKVTTFTPSLRVNYVYPVYSTMVD